MSETDIQYGGYGGWFNSPENGEFESLNPTGFFVLKKFKIFGGLLILKDIHLSVKE